MISTAHTLAFIVTSSHFLYIRYTLLYLCLPGFVWVVFLCS